MYHVGTPCTDFPWSAYHSRHSALAVQPLVVRRVACPAVSRKHEELFQVLRHSSDAACSPCTACSSSFMALHDAVLDLQRGRVDFAIVGGSSAIFRPATTLAFLRLKCAWCTSYEALTHQPPLRGCRLASFLPNSETLPPEVVCKSLHTRGNGCACAKGVAVGILRRYVLRSATTLPATLLTCMAYRLCRCLAGCCRQRARASRLMRAATATRGRRGWPR